MEFMSVVITVTDLKRSTKFYTELLQQKVAMDLDGNIAFESGISLQDIDLWENFIDTPKAEIRLRNNSGELYFEVECIDRFIKDATDYGVEFIHGKQETSWGQSAVRFYDPDGHIIEVGEQMDFVIKRFITDGKTMEEIAKMTSYPLDVIMQIKDRC